MCTRAATSVKLGPMGWMHAFAFHGFQQFIDPGGFEDIKRLSHNLGKLDRLPVRRVHVLEQVFGVKNADDVVGVVGGFADDGDAGMSHFEETLTSFFECGIGLNAVHVGARHHDGRDVFFLQFHHAMNHGAGL